MDGIIPLFIFIGFIDFLIVVFCMQNEISSTDTQISNTSNLKTTEYKHLDCLDAQFDECRISKVSSLYGRGVIIAWLLQCLCTLIENLLVFFADRHLQAPSPPFAYFCSRFLNLFFPTWALGDVIYRSRKIVSGAMRMDEEYACIVASATIVALWIPPGIVKALLDPIRNIMASTDSEPGHRTAWAMSFWNYGLLVASAITSTYITTQIQPVAGEASFTVWRRFFSVFVAHIYANQSTEKKFGVFRSENLYSFKTTIAWHFLEVNEFGVSCILLLISIALLLLIFLMAFTFLSQLLFGKRRAEDRNLPVGVSSSATPEASVSRDSQDLNWPSITLLLVAVPIFIGLFIALVFPLILLAMYVLSLSPFLLCVSTLFNSLRDVQFLPHTSYSITEQDQLFPFISGLVMLCFRILYLRKAKSRPQSSLPT